MASRRSHFPDQFLLAMMIYILLQIGILSACRPQDYSPSPLPSEIPPPSSPTKPPLPDLIIREIRSRYDLSDPCLPAFAELQIGVHIKNQGNADAGSFVVELNNAWQIVQDGLGAGQELTVWFAPGSPLIRAQVDATHQISESNEGNNSLIDTMKVSTPTPKCESTPTPVIAYEGPAINLEGHTAGVWSVDFSPDGALVASGSTDNTLRFWRATEGTLLRTMTGHPFPVLALRFSPNGATLVTGSTDGVVRIWRVSDGSLTRNLEGHAGWVSGLAISNDSTMIASSAEDFTVRIWGMSDGRLAQTIDEGMGAIHDLAFSPDDQVLAWGEDNGIVRVRALSGEWIHKLELISEPATSVDFSNDGAWLVVGYADGSLRVWDRFSGALLQTLISHNGAISDLAFSKDGKWLVSGSRDNTIRLWRIVDERIQEIPVRIFSGHSAPINSVAFSPRSNLIASGSDDHTVRLWAIPEELLLEDLPIQDDR
jgi:WD40 repeat protein